MGGVQHDHGTQVRGRRRWSLGGWVLRDIRCWRCCGRRRLLLPAGRSGRRRLLNRCRRSKGPQHQEESRNQKSRCIHAFKDIRKKSDAKREAPYAARRVAPCRPCAWIHRPCRIKSAALSAIIIVGAFVFPATTRGITEASTTRSPSIPRTRNLSSTTASSSLPILQVPAG